MVKMKPKNDRDISIRATAFYMKIVGFWLANNHAEELRRHIAMSNTVFALTLGLFVEARDCYFTCGNFNTSIYLACNIASLGMGLFKMLILFIYKKKFHGLIIYAKQNFWHTDYDEYEQTILNNCKRTCTFFICIFNFFAQGTLAFYIVEPIVENINRNESDRVLPFNMWVNLPLSKSPYFEGMFVFQVVCLYHIGVSYLCFDNFLCIVNVHAAGQFRILQYRLEKLCETVNSENDREINNELKHKVPNYYEDFRKNVQLHQSLIAYCQEVEEVFTMIVLGQVILFSLLICLDGYLVLMETASAAQRLTFGFHIIGCMIQLLMFTYSCDSIIQESSNVANAAYRGHWTELPMDKNGKMIRKDLTMVMLRCQTPCCLTASGFFVVSLETYTTVLSTAVSYFTLLTHY